MAPGSAAHCETCQLCGFGKALLVLFFVECVLLGMVIGHAV